MSGKLDQSLDQIMKDTKPTGSSRGRRNVGKRRAATKAKAAIAAPTGGVRKNTRINTRAAPAPAVVAPATGDSKIIVSNLPEDVTETQIKDYFGKTIGSVKRAILQYGPNGRSRGIATIIFGNSASAARATQQLDGVKVDNRAMRVEVVLGAKQAPAPTAPKGLAERMAQPKSAAKDKARGKAKPATTKPNGVAPVNDGAKVKGDRNRKSGRGGKGKAKTAEELDAEMVDYFGADGAPANGAVPAPATGVDTGMDEVL